MSRHKTYEAASAFARDTNWAIVEVAAGDTFFTLTPPT
jgi:hypothetical protein